MQFYENIRVKSKYGEPADYPNCYCETTQNGVKVKHEKPIPFNGGTSGGCHVGASYDIEFTPNVPLDGYRELKQRYEERNNMAKAPRLILSMKTDASVEEVIENLTKIIDEFDPDAMIWLGQNVSDVKEGKAPAAKKAKAAPVAEEKEVDAPCVYRGYQIYKVRGGLFDAGDQLAAYDPENPEGGYCVVAGTVAECKSALDEWLKDNPELVKDEVVSEEEETEQEDA